MLILIALDTDIIEFGNALAEQRENVSAWYVPGPRDVLEYVDPSDIARIPFFQARGVDSSVLPLQAITVDDVNASSAAWKLAKNWRDKFQRTPITSQAVQMYDAISLLDAAVVATNKRLCWLVSSPTDCAGKKIEVAVDVYQEELRRTIASIKYRGAGGLITFDEKGDTLSPVYYKELKDGRMQALDPLH